MNGLQLVLSWVLGRGRFRLYKSMIKLRCCCDMRSVVYLCIDQGLGQKMLWESLSMIVSALDDVILLLVSSVELYRVWTKSHVL